MPCSPGKPRLSKFYTPIPPLVQQDLIAQIFSLIQDRPAGLCNFLDAPDLAFPTPGNFGSGSGSGSWSASASASASASGKGKEREREKVGRRGGGDDDSRVIYRHYATLYFV
jgi:AP-3 complex subunit sigma